MLDVKPYFLRGKHKYFKKISATILNGALRVNKQFLQYFFVIISEYFVLFLEEQNIFITSSQCY